MLCMADTTIARDDAAAPDPKVAESATGTDLAGQDTGSGNGAVKGKGGASKPGKHGRKGGAGGGKPGPGSHHEPGHHQHGHHEHERSHKPVKLSNEIYEAELLKLQNELVSMQQWIKESGSRLVVIFEGRDAAGKGSAIKRITEYLNPRNARVAALPAPTERERTQWYYQRYIAHLPAAGEITLFDRSWYNRAGVERVMGFCTNEEYRRFLRQTPVFERMLVDEGILLRKYWFSVSDKEQERRFRSRRNDPLRQWKLSPMDVQSITRWEDYSRAKDDMFAATDIPEAPWYNVDGEVKKHSRLNVISHLLRSVPFERKSPPVVEIPQRPVAQDYQRPPMSSLRYVPDFASTLL